MEFGIFIQGYTPNFRREVDPDAEHHALMDDLKIVKAADDAGFKYVWVTEHHFLDEYSHLSANDAYLGYLAHSTSRIHLGSGIFNPLPQVNHPAKVAERVAMLDHLSDGRFEFGTGRGAGSHEILGFLHKDGITDTSATREIWEDVIREFPKMWMQDEYQGYEGKWWSLPPRKILPKPYHKPHPAMWYAAGNTSSYAMAARYGLGVLGFSVGSFEALEPVVEAYKNEIPNAEPIGAYVNDNLMVTTGAFVAETGGGGLGPPPAGPALELPREQRLPLPRHVPPPADGAGLAGAHPRFHQRDHRTTTPIQPGGIIGTPDHALEQCRRWEARWAPIRSPSASGRPPPSSRSR